MNVPRKKPTDRLSDRMSSRLEGLSPGLKAVLIYIDENRGTVIAQSALEIAAQTGTSDATVIRAIQALGFEGLRELKAELKNAMMVTMSSADKMAATTDDLGSDLASAISYVAESHRKAADHMSDPANHQSMLRAIDILQGAERVGIFGIGASGILADYAARMFTRNGFPAYALNRTGLALGDQLLSMTQGDVMIMMAQESAHREGITALDEAARLRVPTILLTASQSTAFQQRATVTVIAPRGKGGRFPVHGAILMYLEAIILGLAAVSSERSSKSMRRLNLFYNSIRKRQRKV